MAALPIRFCREQRLLNAIGITAQTAGHWRPSPRPRPHAEALRHARTWAADHGHLCPPIKTVRDGFPLGKWLDSQRQLAKKRTALSRTSRCSPRSTPGGTLPGPSCGNAPTTTPAPTPTTQQPATGYITSNAAGSSSTPTNNTSSPQPASLQPE
ncbi:helicase associated domain-containing protein [Streptomyces lateritius]|uniref:Helicase associated domain-containing protein n=1 Tax=Streptomyces lateritius TaxID=67313 RepID=A0ABW6YIP3_9ACTN